jgi:hypothetical protein
MHVSALARQLMLPKFLRAFCLSFAGLFLFIQTASAANLKPTISGTAATWVYVGSQYLFKPTAKDPEGRALYFVVANKPSWANFSTKTGQLSGTPSATGLWNNIKITVTDGVNVSVLPAFSIRATSRSNVAPTISGSPATSAKPGSAYSFAPIAKDSNSDPLYFTIANRPAWASFDPWTGRLTGTPSNANVGTYSSIAISVSDGSKSASLAAFTISVAGSTSSTSSTTKNYPPAIVGTPPKTATVGKMYSFRPYAGDVNRDPLGFSIQNKPSWATFATSTGTLSGVPTAAGTHSNIIISVSDGKATTSLRAFTITVSGGATISNTPPTISGTSVSSVNAGSTYSFKPSASDANGDSLTFSIANRPSWASFNSSTGQLAGTPSSSHAGSYSNIVISVSDGKATVSLPAFSISVAQSQPRSAMLSWTAPTENTDGSTLTNLAGYRIAYGTSASVLSQTIQVSNAGVTTYVVENLSPGTYYFAIKAYTVDGSESAASNIVSKTVQ